MFGRVTYLLLFLVSTRCQGFPRASPADAHVYTRASFAVVGWIEWRGDYTHSVCGSCGDLEDTREGIWLASCNRYF